MPLSFIAGESVNLKNFFGKNWTNCIKNLKLFLSIDSMDKNWYSNSVSSNSVSRTGYKAEYRKMFNASNTYEL